MSAAHDAPPEVSELVVGIVGGTGPQGRGLAWRLASARQRVLIGSRQARRAAHVAGELADTVPAGLVRGADNATIAEEADLAIVAVPWEGHGATVAGLRGPLTGKVVIDCVNPLGFDRRGAYVVAVPEGSVAEQAQALLPDSAVVGAFHHLSAVLLSDPNLDRIESDVMVLGDDRAATDTVQALADRIPGMRGIYAGRLRNCRQVEALTANLVSINRRYKTHSGLRISYV